MDAETESVVLTIAKANVHFSPQSSRLLAVTYRNYLREKMYAEGVPVESILPKAGVRCWRNASGLSTERVCSESGTDILRSTHSLRQLKVYLKQLSRLT